ncbi:hypothetical protein NEOLEDRAFT_1067006 [Neolentinus lepideus HHB14362 ss-1]|uniref:Mitochondrial distribution and morphology protein 34 n=1 Tax=Neolentinus lepideus HHB14362 ss-1 TaxID=1314782 RepID=A0A165S1T1_9AGAM|nr:hypothetical protein NEOLEDRAFT_1067006 [Neolentinus lepideus HHB14362 ss-1]
MSFTFNWPRFSDQFHADAIQMLNSALNKGNKPPIIADKIEVVELEMGTQPPELEIRDIGELTLDQFRGIFRLTYSGDAHLVLRTKVQANPLNHKHPDIHLIAGSRGMLAAKQPLVVPMLLRLSHIKLSSYVVLVVSKQKGITLVFKTDPLQNVDINSTFDSIAVIQKYIQREIEGQLRQMFREDLPGIIHRLSQQWVKAKVEAPYLSKRPKAQSTDAMSLPSIPRYPRTASVGLPVPPSYLRHHTLGVSSLARLRSPSSSSLASTTRETPPSVISSPPVQIKSPSQDSPMSFPDIENFDPTYGLRPEGLPTKSLFNSFGRLFAPNKGLASLTEEPVEDLDEVGSGSFDVVEWEDTIPDYTPPSSVTEVDDSAEYETIPAVGGGVITRPRVFHSQSQIQSLVATPDVSASTSSLSRRPSRGPRSAASTSRLIQSTPSLPLSTRHLRALQASSSPYDFKATPISGRTYGSLGLGMEAQESPWLQDSDHHSLAFTSLRRPPSRPTSPDSQAHSEYLSQDGVPIRRPFERRSSVSSSNFDGFHSGSPPMYPTIHEHDPKIVLRPALNNSVSQLSTLSHSNHTLSPYTRSLEHFTVRSVPHRSTALSGLAAAAERPARAKRKRTYRLGGKKQPDTAADSPNLLVTPSSPTPPSEFDESDMDHYFRSREETRSRYTNSPIDSSFSHRRYPHQPVQRTPL